MTTLDDVTQSKRNGCELGGESGTGHVEDPARVGLRLRPRLRALVATSARFPFRGSLIAVGSWLAVLGRRLRDCSPYADRPASVRDVVDYTRAGGWVPGDHPLWVELPGYVYGWLVAVPVTVTLYAVAWVLQRPSRLALACFTTVLLGWAW